MEDADSSRPMRGDSTPMALDEARVLAGRAHAGQVDKAGRPYTEHLERVAQRVGDPEAELTALLHEVLEDTATRVEDLLSAGCSPAVVEAVVALTRKKGEPYLDFVRQAAANPLAAQVKAADLADNADEFRLSLLPVDQPQRLRHKYAEALEVLRTTVLEG